MILTLTERSLNKCSTCLRLEHEFWDRNNYLLYNAATILGDRLKEKILHLDCVRMELVYVETFGLTLSKFLDKRAESSSDVAEILLDRPPMREVTSRSSYYV